MFLQVVSTLIGVVFNHIIHLFDYYSAIDRTSHIICLVFINGGEVSQLYVMLTGKRHLLLLVHC